MSSERLESVRGVTCFRELPTDTQYGSHPWSECQPLLRNSLILFTPQSDMHQEYYSWLETLGLLMGSLQQGMKLGDGGWLVLMLDDIRRCVTCLCISSLSLSSISLVLVPVFCILLIPSTLSACAASTILDRSG